MENKENIKEIEEAAKSFVAGSSHKDPNGSEEIDTVTEARKNISLLEETSESEYIELVKDIANVAKEQLKNQNDEKISLKCKLFKFIKWFLIIQYLVLVLVLIFNSFEATSVNSCLTFSISDDVINAYIVSVFAETLVGLIAIIKFAFDSKQETEILKILSNIVAGYKKYKSDKEEIKENKNDK